MGIKIIEAFVKMRQMLTDTLTLKLDIEEIKKKLQNQDKNIELVFSYLDEMMDKKTSLESRKRIGYKRKDEEKWSKKNVVHHDLIRRLYSNLSIAASR